MAFQRSAYLQHVALRFGVIDGATLSRLGATRHQIEALVASGELVRVRRGVFRHAATRPTFEQRVALALVDSTVLAARHTAGRLLGLPHLPRTDAIHVVVPPGGARRITGAVVHRAAIDRRDRVLSESRLVCTSPERTICDLAAVLDDARTERIIEFALHHRLMSLRSFKETAARQASRGRAGTERLARVLAARPASGKPSASALELAVFKATRAVGFPTPERNVEMRLPNGRKIVADLWWPDLRLIVEVDHHHWHTETFDRTRDVERDRLCARLGITTLRVTDREVRDRLDRVVADIVAVLQRTSRQRG